MMSPSTWAECGAGVLPACAACRGFGFAYAFSGQDHRHSATRSQSSKGFQSLERAAVH